MISSISDGVNLICRGKQHCFLCLWLFVHTRSIILVLHLAVKWHLSKRETVHLLQYVKTCSGKKGYGVHVCQYTADLIDLLCCCMIACGANVHSQEQIWICWLYQVKKKNKNTSLLFLFCFTWAFSFTVWSDLQYCMNTSMIRNAKKIQQFMYAEWHKGTQTLLQQHK